MDVTDPAGDALTTANDPQSFAVTAGGAITTAPVGFQARGDDERPGVRDTNGNGSQGGGDTGIANVTVTLTDAFGATRSTTSDANGDYSFSAVPGGSVSVDLAAPAGHALTTGNDPQNVTITAGGSAERDPGGVPAPGDGERPRLHRCRRRRHAGRTRQRSGRGDGDRDGHVRRHAHDHDGWHHNYSVAAVRRKHDGERDRPRRPCSHNRERSSECECARAASTATATPVGFQPGAVHAHVFRGTDGTASTTAARRVWPA